MAVSGLKILYVIPARGGSKGIPEKNIKVLGAQPLIYYTLDVALQMAPLADICVSTDDVRIKKTVEARGVPVPFLRSANISTDTASTQDVILDALAFYETRGVVYDLVVLLQPTSPFRKVADVENALNNWEHGIDMVVSVKETRSNPYTVLFEENDQGFLQKSKEGRFTRRQDCPLVYEYNGAVYVMSAESLKSKEIVAFTKIKKTLMSEIESVDIDTELDWLVAEVLLGRTNKEV